ncbi:MAG: MATE family efflux transporter, partial [Burkholderiaceae bacterium]
LWVGAYHLADSMQALCVFVLRCYRVTVAPLLVYCVLLWGLGLAGGYGLAYRGLGPLAAQATPAAFWATSAVALALTAFIFVALLRRAVRQPAPGHEQAPHRQRI